MFSILKCKEYSELLLRHVLDSNKFDTNFGVMLSYSWIHFVQFLSWSCNLLTCFLFIGLQFSFMYCICIMWMINYRNDWLHTYGMLFLSWILTFVHFVVFKAVFSDSQVCICFMLANWLFMSCLYPESSSIARCLCLLNLSVRQLSLPILLYNAFSF